MRKALTAAVILLAALIANPTPAQAFPASTRSALVGYLSGISGQYTITGQHNREPNSDPTKWTRVAQGITGQTPGLWGGDFLFASADVNARQTMISEAIRQWQGGSLVALTWHMCPPTVGSTCGWDTNGVLSHLSDSQWSQLVTDGSALNTAFKNRLAEATPYLRQLQSAGVPVLFRPVHEMNEGWSWWGGRPGANGSRRLFQIVHDYYAGQGLSNLVWVWNVKDVNMGAIADYWPGASYVDVATLDMWVKLAPSTSDYQAMLNVAGGKPIALAEVGQVPSVALLQAQPRWTYFMVWAEYLQDPAYNTNAAVQNTYFSNRVLVRGEFTVPGGTTGGGGSGGTGPVTGLAGKCLDVAAAGTANGTRIQLYTCNGGTAQTWTAGSDGTLRALGKCADVTGGVNADGTKVQLWDCNGNGHQQWTRSGSTLVNPETGKCLDVTGQSSADGTPIQIWTCNGQTNQRWTGPA
ncbi:lectin [Dactylosporangium sp. NPDC051541]|uniref:lectin n=1 Tax=Dactylosporangium sp. NPDC051541 TaxID=3363977 RepID=UPI0037A7B03F